MTTNKLPPKVPGSCDSSKVLLCNFKDISLRSLAKAGQLHFCQYISVIEAFLFPNQKEDICWTCLELATKNSEEMKNTLRSAEGDMMTKRDLIDYVGFILYCLLNS